MKRIMALLAMTLLALPLTAAAAVAAPTKATNYEEIEATCEELGEIVIVVVGAGEWSVGKVQGTKLTLIPQAFDFMATNLDTDEVLFQDSVSKQDAHIDDVCTFSGVEEIPPGVDPFLPEGGTILFEGTVYVKLVGPPR